MTTTTVLADGIYFGEGPRWHDDRLWFSDFYAHAVKSCTIDGKVTVEFTMDDQPSGLGWLPDGRLLVVSMRDRKVLTLNEADVLKDARAWAEKVKAAVAK